MERNNNDPSSSSGGGGGGMQLPSVVQGSSSSTLHHLRPQQQHLFPFRQEVMADDRSPRQLRQPYAVPAVPFGDDGTKSNTATTTTASAASPWQRMKWTDNMVRLLIMIVYSVGDDAAGAADHQQHQQPAAAASSTKGSKKAAATATMATSKGKWKSVSRAMMEKGFYVSPQQCEDKFNDLNKRYKRVNELIGKGTACRVVENHALLDTLDHLSPKSKEEARKLLNSKHLFFPEMCAYHSSMAMAGAGAASSSTCAASLPRPPQPQQQQQEKQICFHHPATEETLYSGGKGGNSNGGMTHGHDYNDEEYSGDDDDDDDDDGEEDFDHDDDEEDENKDGLQFQHQHQHHPQQQKVKGNNCMAPFSTSSFSASPPLSLSLSPSPIEQLKSDLMGSLAANGGDQQQQKQWLKRKAIELEEQRVAYQSRALEIERQRFKWIRFSSNKERELERTKLRNDRLRLQNERMLLLLRQKEQEIISQG